MSTASSSNVANDVLSNMLQRIHEQDWPTGCLYVVATPIGNLGDLSLRAWQALLRADLIAAEDTRTVQPLLQAWGIPTPVRALHRHNEAQATEGLIKCLAQDQRIALVSDAGAPAISDPGGRVVQRVRQAGYRIVPIAGPSALTAALMASGISTDAQPAFIFAGFSPHKSHARKKWLQHWLQQDLPVVFFESPHRLQACIDDLCQKSEPNRLLTICKELTKRFEHIKTGSIQEIKAWLAADASHRKGEFVLLLHALAQEKEPLDQQTQQWVQALLGHMSLRDTVRLTTQVTGLPRQLIYDFALQAQQKHNAVK